MYKIGKTGKLRGFYRPFFQEKILAKQKTPTQKNFCIGHFFKIFFCELIIAKNTLKSTIRAI